METKAAVLREYNKPLTIETLELEDPKANEVLVRVVACGVCHSDLHAIKGDLPFPTPAVLGHEIGGIVEKVGPGVSRVQVGDHVICAYMFSCGKCFHCLNGNHNLCETAMPCYLMGTLLDGTSRLRDKKGDSISHLLMASGFSQYAVTPEDNAVVIPKDVPLDKASLIGCCVPTGYGAVVQVAKLQPHSAVGVWGCGGVGLSTITAASMVAAYPIIAVDLEGSKEKIALELGATHFIDSSREDPVTKIQELTGERGVDYAFECVGDPGAQVQAFWAVRQAGTLILEGVAPIASTAAFPTSFLTLHDKKVIGSLYGSQNNHLVIPKLVGLYMGGALKLDKMISRKIKLQEINEAFEAMEKRQILGRWVIAME